MTDSPRGGAATDLADRNVPAEPAHVPAARRGRTRPGSRFLPHLLANGVLVLVLALWWWFSRSASPMELPGPIAVAEKTVDLLIGQSAVHTWTSMFRILLSVVFAMAIGGALVFLSSTVPVTSMLVGSRLLPFFNSVPALGWAILGVIWFGVGDFAAVFVVTAILIPFCLVNLWEGMRAIDPGLREMGRSFTRSRARVLISIELPLLAPYIFAAVRLSFSVGWKVAIIAEFFGARSGLGLVMNRARQSFDTPTVFATIVVVLIIVMVTERLIFDPVARWFARRTGTEVAA